MRRLLRTAVIALAVFPVLLAGPANASPDTTPTTPAALFYQSDEVLLLEIKGIDGKGVATASVRKALKADANRPTPKEVRLDLLSDAGNYRSEANQIARWIAGGKKQALFFVGSFDLAVPIFEANEQAAEVELQNLGLLHMEGTWLILNKKWRDDDAWQPWRIQLPDFLKTPWDGGTDMLLRCIEYLKSDERASFPARAGVQWDKSVKLGEVAGQVYAAEAVDLRGKGRAELFLASEKGDQLISCDGNGAPSAVQLKSRSRAHAWADFNRDGRLDLVSWDGNGLAIYLQNDRGGFDRVACKTGDALKDGCVRMDVLDSGGAGGTGVLVSTNSWPVLLLVKSDGNATARPLGGGDFPVRECGAAGPCLVEDFDGDGIADVFQACSLSPLFYKGKGGGEFAPPVRVGPPSDGRKGRIAPRALCAGDFDGDGLLDAFAATDAGGRLWQNDGNGRFTEVARLSGKAGSMVFPGAIVVQSGDFNNDARQDLLIAYESNSVPQLFFNRGFRSFLYAWDLDIGHEKGVLDPSLGRLDIEAQQAACLGDFNGDGALDMAVVLKNGDVWLFPRKVDKDGPARGVVVSLPLSAPTAGPLNVQAYSGKRLLGAWSLRAGAPGTIIGTRSSGPITLKWNWPDGKPQDKKVKVGDRVTPVSLDKE